LVSGKIIVQAVALAGGVIVFAPDESVTKSISAGEVSFEASGARYVENGNSLVNSITTRLVDSILIGP
jgi:hypothetical protein